MTQETKGNYCSRCGENKVRIITYDDGSSNGICHSCGNQISTPPIYQEQTGIQSSSNFGGLNISSIFEFINKYAFLIAIIALMITLSSFASISGLQNYAMDEFEELHEDIDDNHNLLTSSLNTTNNNIQTNSNILTAVNTSINIINDDIESLYDETSAIDDINNNITNINENITAILNTTEDDEHGEFLNNSVFNLKIKEVPNQTSITRYAYINATLSNTINNLTDTTFMIGYPNASIEEISNTSTYTPTSTGNNTSCVTYHFFNIDTQLSANFILSWNTANYNTSTVSTSTLDSLISTNGMYFNFNISKV